MKNNNNYNFYFSRSASTRPRQFRQGVLGDCGERIARKSKAERYGKGLCPTTALEEFAKSCCQNGQRFRYKDFYFYVKSKFSTLNYNY